MPLGNSRAYTYTYTHKMSTCTFVQTWYKIKSYFLSYIDSNPCIITYVGVTGGSHFVRHHYFNWNNIRINYLLSLCLSYWTIFLSTSVGCCACSLYVINCSSAYSDSKVNSLSLFIFSPLYCLLFRSIKESM
jgi:hypothetical protein